MEYNNNNNKNNNVDCDCSYYYYHKMRLHVWWHIVFWLNEHNISYDDSKKAHYIYICNCQQPIAFGIFSAFDCRESRHDTVMLLQLPYKLFFSLHLTAHNCSTIIQTYPFSHIIIMSNICIRMIFIEFIRSHIYTLNTYSLESLSQLHTII